MTPGLNGPRIIGGAWRGKHLAAPAGLATRPTASRARQALFDILLHAPWGGLELLQRSRVLDVFAGTGAFGLEALSRGAASASFIENNGAALSALRANIASCRVAGIARVVAADALVPPAGTPHDVLVLDPPYGQDLLPKALVALARQGWVAPGALIVAELGPVDPFAPPDPLAERRQGKARLLFWHHKAALIA